MIAAILAGGKSRRMGRDKAFVEYGGARMIDRALGAVRPCVDQVIIIANDPGAYRELGVPVYPDTIRGMGPLSGLYTAFEVTGADELLLVACDMPLLRPEVVRHIVSRALAPGEAVIPLAGGREQGLLAIYRRGAIDRWRERIEAASIQFDEFREGLERSFISEEELRAVDPALESFINVNAPGDLPEGG